MPTNLKIGTAFKTELDVDNVLSTALDFRKLLVPFNQSVSDQSVMEGIIASFNPNSGFSISDIGISTGIEYAYKRNIFLRCGYNIQGDERATGSFFSFGFGLKHKSIGINMAYISGNPQRSFLSNTLRITLGYSINK